MKKALIYLGKDKNNNFIFKKADIADILIEASGLGQISRLFNMGIKNPLIWINKNTLKWIEDDKSKKETAQ